MTDESDRGERDVRPEYDPEEEVYRLEHDFERDGRISLTILVGLEMVALEDPKRQADPLFEAVDPDALDALFRPGTPLPLRDRGELTFPTGDYEVTVHADGRTEIRPR